MAISCYDLSEFIRIIAIHFPKTHVSILEESLKTDFSRFMLGQIDHSNWPLLYKLLTQGFDQSCSITLKLNLHAFCHMKVFEANYTQ